MFVLESPIRYAAWITSGRVAEQHEHRHENRCRNGPLRRRRAQHQVDERAHEDEQEEQHRAREADVLQERSRRRRP